MSKKGLGACVFVFGLFEHLVAPVSGKTRRACGGRGAATSRRCCCCDPAARPPWFPAALANARREALLNGDDRMNNEPRCVNVNLDLSRCDGRTAGWVSLFLLLLSIQQGANRVASCLALCIVNSCFIGVESLKVRWKITSDPTVGVFRAASMQEKTCTITWNAKKKRRRKRSVLTAALSLTSPSRWWQTFMQPQNE